MTNTSTDIDQQLLHALDLLDALSSHPELDVPTRLALRSSYLPILSVWEPPLPDAPGPVSDLPTEVGALLRALTRQLRTTAATVPMDMAVEIHAALRNVLDSSHTGRPPAAPDAP